MGESFVYFGILHAIAVSSVLALTFLWAPVWATGIAAVFFLALPFFVSSALFEAPPLLWLGLSPNPRPTVDYVPIFPWFGVVLGGMVAGRLFLDFALDRSLSRWRPTGGFWRAVMFAGRWSLPIYLVHQPLMIGALTLAIPLVGESEATLATRFMNQCTNNCRATAAGKDAVCQATCGCVATGAQGAGILPPAMAGTMTPEEDKSWSAIVEACLAKRGPPATGS